MILYTREEFDSSRNSFGKALNKLFIHAFMNEGFMYEIMQNPSKR